MECRPTPRHALWCILVFAIALRPTSARAQDRAACLASYDAGQAARDERKLVKARAEFTTCASDTCPEVLRKDCLEWLKEADKVVPSVVLRALDERGHDATGVAVDIDGAPRVERLDGKAIAVDPGAHTFRFRAAGKAPIEQSAVIAEGEKNRPIVARFPAVTGDAKTSGPAPARPLLPTVVAAGVAIVALGGATYFYARGFHDGDALRASCGSPPSCSREDVDAVHTKLVIGDVLAGIGLVAVGVTAYFALIRKPSSTRAARVPVLADGTSVRF